MLILWGAVFVVSLAVLIKGSDYVLGAAERIGAYFGMTPFIIGVVVVGFGTSLPELASSIAGVIAGANELVAANVVGSNIANILLIAGIAAVAGRRLTVGKDLVDLDIPMLAIATVFFLSVAYDGAITRPEAAILVVAFLIYLTYAVFHVDDSRGAKAAEEFLESKAKQTIPGKEVIFLFVGLGMLLLGARYLVEAVLAISDIIGIGVGVISLVAVAVGTSMPELVVSIKAGLAGKSDVSLGNIFGSNVFNILFVVGIPGLIAPLVIDAQTFAIGIPVMIGATFLFIISTLSNRFHNYEGALYILLYVLFLGKLSGLL